MARRYDPNIHHRQSIWLRGYDYTQAGAYFVTICTQERQCLFGTVVDGEMQLNDIGEIVAACWHDLPNHFPHVALDAFVVMPNHVHGIVVLEHAVPAGSSRPTRVDDPQYMKGAVTAPLHNERRYSPSVGAGSPRPTPMNHTQRPVLGRVIAYFKYQSTKHTNTLRDTPGAPVWQRNYYDHIIRNDHDLDRIRDYIATNLLRWDEDQLHPNNPSKW